MGWEVFPEGYYAAVIAGQLGLTLCKRSHLGWSMNRYVLADGVPADAVDSRDLLGEAESYVSENLAASRAAFDALECSCERCDKPLLTRSEKWHGLHAICVAQERLENPDLYESDCPVYILD